MREHAGSPRTMSELVQWRDPVAATATAGSVAESFHADDDLATLLVRCSDGRIGAVPRVSFFAAMTGQMGFGWALRARQPIGSLLEANPLVVESTRSVIEVGLELLADGGSPDFEDVVVVDAARAGTVRVELIYRAVSEEFRRRAGTDELTGLLNRRGVMEQVSLAANSAGGTGDAEDGVVVLFVDLDRFKLVNDAFGHQAGDRVILDAASRLRSLLPEQALSARMGGDEFLVVLPGTVSTPVVDALAHAVIEVMSHPFTVGTESVRIGATVGVSRAAQGTELHDVLRRADLAMYDGKRRGGNCVSLDGAGGVDELTESARIEHLLPDAIARGDVGAAYQPVVSLDHGELVGAEALARWSNDGTPISPGQFIPIAERCGLLPSMTDRLIERVADERRSVWSPRARMGGPQPWTAINVSASHCSTVGFAERLLARIEETGSDPSSIVVEVTESVVFDHVDRIEQSALVLHRAGVRMFLDDFGAGYSSLAALSQLPWAGVKLDRSLIVGLPRSGRSRATADAVVALAHRLGLVVIAEGVETIEEHRAVLAAGCDLGQGYLYGRPAARFPDVDGGVSAMIPMRRSLAPVLPLGLTSGG